MFKWWKQFRCKHNYQRMDGLMGFFCKVQCTKCQKIDNDYTDAVCTTISFGDIEVTTTEYKEIKE